MKIKKCRNCGKYQADNLGIERSNLYFCCLRCYLTWQKT